MPLTSKGEEIKGAMEKGYGKEKGEQVFYASKNKGTITGVDKAATTDAISGLDAIASATQVRDTQLNWAGGECELSKAPEMETPNDDATVHKVAGV